MTANPERKKPLEFEINPRDLEAARAAFFSPVNNSAGVQQLFDHLWKMADGAHGFTSSNPKVAEVLRSISERLDTARKFDEKYLGHMLSEPMIPGLVGAILAMRVNSNTVAREVSEVESAMEPEAIRMIAEMIGYDPEVASGTFTSGGSLANQLALWVMREKVSLPREEFTGTYVLLVSPFVHYSIEKAARILGGPSKDIEVLSLKSSKLAIDPQSLRVAVDRIYRENEEIHGEIRRLQSRNSAVAARQIQQLERTKKRIMGIISIGGETETGIVDPLAEISTIAQKYGIHHHVDAAYGLPYIWSSRGNLFAGIEQADSVTFDPHKALYAPYSAGAVMFKSAPDHGKIKFGSEEAAYVFKDNEISLGAKRIEGSAGASPILSTLAVLYALSRDEFQALFDYTLNNIEYLYSRLEKSPVLQPVHAPDLNVLCFTISPEVCNEMGIYSNEQLKAVIEGTRKQLNDEHGFFFSATNLPVDKSVKTLEQDAERQYVYRAVLMHPHTSETEIDAAIDALEGILRSVKA